MRISLNWLKKYVEIPVSDEELVRLIGARLVEVEGVIDETHKYDNIYVVRVARCEKIPDTHLTLCQIDVGGVNLNKVEKNADGLVQVVCGAPNVRAGMFAVWIAPGAIVPASVREDAPFVIGKRKMRGYESNGMLAGADELDFDDKHEKIVEIDPEKAQPGDLLSDVFGLSDYILEIENKSLTHRPDCFGIIGFAREVAGILGQKFDEPDFYTHEEVFPRGFLVQSGNGVKSKDDELVIEIADSLICPRYSGAKLKITEMGGREKYLSEMQVLIAKSGMMPVSRIVDITNYVMLLTGQPLHAFDADKFLAVGGTDQAKIGVRLAKNGEKLVLLDGSEVELNGDDIVITSNDKSVALAGAMGGQSTMIDDNTKNVILESASFSLYNLRKTQMAHGIFSEAITRFTKGTPAAGTFSVLAEAIKEIGGKVFSVNDCFPGWRELPDIEISVDEINGLLGTDYSDKLIIKTLENVGFFIKRKKNGLKIGAPGWRTDIHIKEDIIEEVGRLLGYDNIEPILPLHGTASNNKVLELKSQIRDTLYRFGANEVLTYSFVSGRLMERVRQEMNNAYKIVNSISPELQFVRQSIVPSLLEKAYVNQKLPVEKFAMFEMNEVHRKEWGLNDEGVPAGRISLGFVLAERKNTETAYYMAKKYVASLMNELGVSVDFVKLEGESAELRPFEPKRSAIITSKDGDYLGVVGEFRNSVRNEFKLAPYLAGFELVDLDKIIELVQSKRRIEFGPVRTEDLTLTTDKTYADVLKEVQKQYPDATIEPLYVYQAPGQKTRNISFRIKERLKEPN